MRGWGEKGGGMLTRRWLLGGVLAGSIALLGAGQAVAQGHPGGYWDHGGMIEGYEHGGTMGGYYDDHRSAPMHHEWLGIDDHGISARQDSVPAGTMVVWRNTGRASHEIVFPSIWDSGAIRPGGSRGAILATPGTYDYQCADHPEEHGQLTVTAP